MAKVLEAKQIYEKLKEELGREAKAQNSLTLASLSAGENFSTKKYLFHQEKLAKELAIEYLHVDLGESPKEAARKIEELNKDEGITGIIANKPFPSGFKDEVIFSAITPLKDIEGMNPYNLGRLFLGQPLFISPTVLSVLELLKMAKVELYGREVTIVGFSNLIGASLAILLARQFATVSITHIATYEVNRLPFYVKNAQVLISAAGKPHLIKGDWIKEKAVVIDVGTAEVEGKLIGDVEFKEAKEKASYLSPVPGGVGKLTPVFLFKNLIKAARRQS